MEGMETVHRAESAAREVEERRQRRQVLHAGAAYQDAGGRFAHVSG